MMSASPSESGLLPILHETHYDNGYHICTCGVRYSRGNRHPDTITRAQVILFKPSGKYYTEEFWRIPERDIGPYDMGRSPDFRRIGGGAVLVQSQEPWGFPHLLLEY